MQKFHIVYRYADEYVSSGTVVEAEDKPIGLTGAVVPAIVIAIQIFTEANPTAHIIAVNTQELVDLMSSARG